MGVNLHLIKLSVGSDSVVGLGEWQAMRRKTLQRDTSIHVTRMWPKREAELLTGGSIYWVIKGTIQCRQRLLGFDEVIGEDGIRRCGFILSPDLIEVTSTPRRAFQGWRYLSADDAPIDLPQSRSGEERLPDQLAQELSALGLR